MGVWHVFCFSFMHQYDGIKRCCFFSHARANTADGLFSECGHRRASFGFARPVLGWLDLFVEGAREVDLSRSLPVADRDKPI